MARLSRLAEAAAAGCAIAAAQAPGYPNGGGPCETAWDCSLGGVCDANTSTCVCDAWVTGAQCDLLNLAPAVDPDAGLQPPGYYAWGGHALQSPTDGLYHGLFSFMCRHATLGEWTTKSSIWHATSATPTGPYALSDMVAQPWSHNAMLAANPAGGYFLYQIGDAAVNASQWEPCYNASEGEGGQGEGEGSPPAAAQHPHASPPRDGGSGIYIRTAPDLTGPWTLASAAGLTLNATGSWATGGANGGNPAPFFFPNGSVLLYFSANPCPPGWGNISPGNNCIGVARADAWDGVYTVATANPLPVTHPESEDPFVFRDARGFFHLLTNVNNDHTRCAQGVPCGGHAWSYDGLTFSNLTIGAFGPIIRFANGTYWYTAYVERPQVLQAADGTPTALFLGMGRSSYDDSCNWAQAFCAPNQTGCGPTLPPPPPPATLVRYSFGGACLVTNATFPCPGGWGTSCPLFLGDCSAAEAVWAEEPGGTLASNAHAGAVVNIDCGSCATHTLAKAIAVAADAAPIAFTGGQLRVSSCADAGGVCLTGGGGIAGPPTPPCKDGEQFLPSAQLQLAPCSSPDTQGWQRSVVEPGAQ